MSVVVRMEMPENCAVCPFVTEYSRCVFLGMYAIGEDGRADNCPIICQLPEGHGRLVDAAVLKNKNMRKPRGVSSYDYGAMATVFMDIINDTPAIVPAEDGKHE